MQKNIATVPKTKEVLHYDEKQTKIYPSKKYNSLKRVIKLIFSLLFEFSAVQSQQ